MKKFKFSNIIYSIILLLWALTILFPLIWIFYVSLKTNKEFFQSAWSLPKVPQWSNYERAFKSLGIGKAMINTVYYVGLGLVIGMFFTTLNAFALTRVKWKGRKFVWWAVMLSLFLPGINTLVPQYIIVCKLHLNNLNGLILISSVTMWAFDLMVLGGFMQSIPTELEESAYIDGATIFQMFMKIVLPLSMPGVITISIFRFLALYNDFLKPFIFITDQSKYTIGVNMYEANQLMQYQSDYVGLFAGVVIAMIPSLIIYVLFQKRIVEGATLGAVKG